MPLPSTTTISTHHHLLPPRTRAQRSSPNIPPVAPNSKPPTHSTRHPAPNTIGKRIAVSVSRRLRLDKTQPKTRCSCWILRTNEPVPTRRCCTNARAQRIRLAKSQPQSVAGHIVSSRTQWSGVLRPTMIGATTLGVEGIALAKQM